MTVLEAIDIAKRRIEGILASRNSGAQTLYNIWGGWEKWLQGSIILALQGVPFRITQEDNIYRDGAQKSADFVFQLNDAVQRPDANAPPDTCVVELKAITVNQTAAAFRDLVRDDVIKLTGRLSLRIGNTVGVGRLMIAVTVPAKPLPNDVIERAERFVADAGGNGFEVRTELLGGAFLVYYIFWLQGV